MIITDDFIFLHYPKTGGSFTRTVISNIYNNRKKEYSFLKKTAIKLKLLSPELIYYRKTYTGSNIKTQHVNYEQIPVKLKKNKVLFTIIRNPYSRFISNYEFKGFNMGGGNNDLNKVVFERFPHFPNLSFDEFADYLKLIVNLKSSLNFSHSSIFKDCNDKKIGFQTRRFIRMFFYNPKEVFNKLSDDYVFSGAYKKDMPPITFLQQENLRNDLVQFLSQFEFTSKELDSIHQHKKVNVTKDQHPNRNELWTPKTLEYVKTYERYLFKFYKDLGFYYKEP